MTAIIRRVLFICTGNAGRSQMAEALARARWSDAVDVLSAGVAPWPHLHPLAVGLLHERGLDTRGHHPKPVQTWQATPLDVVVTIGEPALRKTPALPGNPRRIHWDLADPADADGTPDAEPTFRRTLQAIEARLPELDAWLHRTASARTLHHQPGLSTGLFQAGGFRPGEHLPRVAAAGFRAIELRCFMGSDGRDDFDWHSAAKVRELGRVAADLGLAVWSVHAPQTAALGEGDTAAYRHDVAVLGAMVELAATLGAQCVPFHGMRQAHAGETAGERAGAWQRMFAGVQPVVDAARRAGVTLAWETGTWPQDDLQAEEWAHIVGPLPQGGLGLALDVGHAHLCGTLDAFLQQAGTRLCTVHLQDNDGKRDLHWVPGEGTVDWGRVLAGLGGAGYVGPWLFEPVAGAAEEDRQRVLAACIAQVQRWAALAVER